MDDGARRGPMSGEPIPLHGGTPTAGGCGGCIDCCHLPEISLTDEEAARLRTLHAAWPEQLEELVVHADPRHEGWQIMRGPCVFRRYDSPLHAGGCRIYADRPAGCDIFTCAFRQELKRAI